MNIPYGTHLFPIEFNELRAIVRSLRLTAMELPEVERKLMYELANKLERELDIALAKEKAMKERSKAAAQRLKKAHFN